jgi:hypothetical protein
MGCGARDLGQGHPPIQHFFGCFRPHFGGHIETRQPVVWHSGTLLQCLLDSRAIRVSLVLLAAPPALGLLGQGEQWKSQPSRGVRHVDVGSDFLIGLDIEDKHTEDPQGNEEHSASEKIDMSSDALNLDLAVLPSNVASLR